MKLSKAIKDYIAKKLAKKHLQNVCPCCHHKGLEYPDGGEIQDDCVSYDWDCPKCGAEGYEIFNMVFDEHGIKSEGNSMKVNIAGAKRALREKKNRKKIRAK